jgi:hypothetical protein
MSLVKIKSGVAPRNLYIVAAIANVAQLLHDPVDIVITAGSDGKHKRGSLHYSYAAIDVRSKNFPNRASKVRFVELVLKRLGADFEGFLEGGGTANEHFHFEYDPK